MVWVEDFTINEMQDMQRNLQEKYNHDRISIGYKEDETANPDDMLLYYTREDIEKYGVVGFELTKNF